MHHLIEFSSRLKKDNCDAYYKQALGCCSIDQCTASGLLSNKPGRQKHRKTWVFVEIYLLLFSLCWYITVLLLKLVNNSI